MSESFKTPPATHQRPILVIVACLLVVLGSAATTIPMSDARIRAAMIDAYGWSFFPINVVFLILGLTGAIGYWKMRRWGVYSYTAMVVASTIYGLLIGVTQVIPYVTPIAIAAVGWIYWGRME